MPLNRHSRCAGIVYAQGFVILVLLWSYNFSSCIQVTSLPESFQDMSCFTHAFAFYTSNNIMKMLMNTEFKAKTSTGNTTGNLQCHVLASRALSISCSFGPSARSIESRCVVIWLIQFQESDPEVAALFYFNITSLLNQFFWSKNIRVYVSKNSSPDLWEIQMYIKVIPHDKLTVMLRGQ